MKFWYLKLQKPTRDERSWVIGVTEAGYNIYYVAAHFGIYKTIANRIRTRVVQRKLAGDRPRSSGSKKLTQLEERFIQIT